jgi:GTPase Era involved in 16S rRNA processing
MTAPATAAESFPAIESGLARRLSALDRALTLSDGRLDADVLGRAHAIVERAGERLRLSGEHTVVALAGPTGSGKSSLFNAIAGVDLSRTGVHRPTTAHPLACVWGPDGAQPLLDWLGIPRRHQLGRETVLDSGSQHELDGLILLDLPDQDSTDLAHRLEADRLVKLVDLLVWVVDPQKYADASLHQGYLQPLATHAVVTLCVLNQVDRLAPAAVEQCVADLRKLVVADGLAGVEILATSAATGAGIRALRETLANRVQEKRAAGERLLADVTRVALELAENCGDGKVPDIDRHARTALVSALGRAAGVPAVLDAVEAAHRVRGALATGWPLTRWLKRLRPDPLRRLHLGSFGRRADIASGEALAHSAPAPLPPRTSLPAPDSIARSQTQTALRAVGDAAIGGLPRPWADAVRRAARSHQAELANELDHAVAATDLGMDRSPRWWSAMGAMQWLFATALVIGLAWLVVLAGFGFLKAPEPHTPELAGWPVPTLLVLGGAFAGLLLAIVARPMIAVGARRRARRAAARLRVAVGEVAERCVLAPVAAEIERYREACQQVRAAAGK